MFEKFKTQMILLLCLSGTCLFFLGCTSSKLVIDTEITAEPSEAKVQFKGREIGTTPLTLEINNVEELTKITAQLPKSQVVETRIRFLDQNRAVVIFHFGDEASPIAKALGLKNILVFDYSDHATFELDSFNLKPNLTPLLTRQAEVLNKYFASLPIYICGHTDETGSDEHNLKLSLKRAQSVSDFLSSHHVSKDRLKIQGFGKNYPMASNSTETGRATNRRTEIVLPQ